MHIIKYKYLFGGLQISIEHVGFEALAWLWVTASEALIQGKLTSLVAEGPGWLRPHLGR